MDCPVCGEEMVRRGGWCKSCPRCGYEE